MSALDFAGIRRNMVEAQIRTNRVTDPRIIDALGSVPRERFVPKRLEGVAYVDEDLEIAPGRYLMEPMVFARLAQGASIDEADVCLDIGSGTGYSATVLGQLAGTVIALESDAGLADEAEENFQALGADNILLARGALESGYPRQGPYDVILLNGSVEHVPDALLAQLAEGGRLVAIVHEPGSYGRATLFVKYHGAVSQRPLFDAAVPSLAGAFSAPAAFRF